MVLVCFVFVVFCFVLSFFCFLLLLTHSKAASKDVGFLAGVDCLVSVVIEFLCVGQEWIEILVWGESLFKILHFLLLPHPHIARIV